MSKIKKIFPIVLGIGLINGCFALTGSAMQAEITNSYQSNSGGECSLQFGSEFKYTVEAGAANSEEEGKKRNVSQSLALFIMIKSILENCQIKGIKDDPVALADSMGLNKLLNPSGKSYVVSADKKSSNLTKEQALELQKILTTANLKGVVITKEMFDWAKNYSKTKLENEISNLDKLNKVDDANILRDNLNKINILDYDFVKTTASNLVKFEVKIFENKQVEIKS